MRERQVKDAWKVVWYVYNRMLLLKEELRMRGKSQEEINRIIDEIRERYLSRVKGETDAYKLVVSLEKVIQEVCHAEDA